MSRDTFLTDLIIHLSQSLGTFRLEPPATLIGAVRFSSPHCGHFVMVFCGDGAKKVLAEGRCAASACRGCRTNSRKVPLKRIELTHGGECMRVRRRMCWQLSVVPLELAN
jgi:hypothetical protein